ncbi:hypothetical protein M9H77_20303 [Catharanthus roseus]|uniref:Uncharacterized protein n=1 Tax=Catharanthus roseus TaxID=4058 RepID=A0ACC0AL35_CATRO|nr:hypothetical protein M9H77_20303 [Catharanthus roseus]
MKLKLVCGILFIHLLILQVIANLDEDSNNINNVSELPMVNSLSKNSNILRLKSMDFQNQEENDEKTIDSSSQVHHHHHHHHHHHIDDPSTIVFFFLDDLKLGKTMPIYFPNRDLSSSHFLPKEEANKIPFSSKQLPKLLQLFSFSKESPQAIAMEDTLRECETNPIKGETKLCATSLSSAVEFALEIFGSDHRIQVLSTNYQTKLTIPLQKYTINKVPKEILAEKMVSCHTMPYPYGILYCHYQESENRVFKVSLVSEVGDKVEAVAVCHMDTSQWGKNHVSFRVLGIEPGTSPVCHFFPADNFVLVPSAST